MIPQEGDDRNNTARRAVQGQLILVDGELLHKLGQARRQVLSVLVQRRRELLGPRRRVESNGLLERRDRGLGCIWAECRCGRSDAPDGDGGGGKGPSGGADCARTEQRGDDRSASHDGDENQLDGERRPRDHRLGRARRRNGRSRVRPLGRASRRAFAGGSRQAALS